MRPQMDGQDAPITAVRTGSQLAAGKAFGTALGTVPGTVLAVVPEVSLETRPSLPNSFSCNYLGQLRPP